MNDAFTLIQRSRRALVLGIGGGGDVVGALAVARLCESLGTPFELGGVAWERFVVDPHPGPRPLDELTGGRRVGDGAMLAGPETRTVDGREVSEAGMAAHLRRDTVLIDVSDGPATAAEGIAAAAAELGCDVAIYADVGGDAIARGSEPGLASPLCDALMLAAGDLAADRVEPIGAVFGAGCDGELTIDEVMARVADLAAADVGLGAWGMPRHVAAELEDAARLVPTEASLQAVRCALGETGEVPIREGRRSVTLSPVGALTFFFDLRGAVERTLPLARAVRGAPGLDAAHEALAALGIRSELAYERARAAEHGAE
jgi:hypothetical protein